MTTTQEIEFCVRLAGLSTADEIESIECDTALEITYCVMLSGLSTAEEIESYPSESDLCEMLPAA